MKTATAFAPATVANVAVGFDILGFAVDAVGDKVTVSKIDSAGKVEIETVSGNAEIPKDPEKNTATVGLLKLCKDLKLKHGFKVSIKKGIPLGSGMGGSAASAVGAIVAANALLNRALTQEKLIEYALEGESAASGSKHADNVAPCLLGGLVLSRSVDPFEFVRIPFPKKVLCVLVHPDVQVNTREARGILKAELSLKDHVKQSTNLAGFIASCFQTDTDLMEKSLHDLIIEPQRAHLIPAFEQVKAAALGNGAIGCSISGSGPSMFAFATNTENAGKIKKAMLSAFANAGIQADGWISRVRTKGAKLI